jgi:serine/threonine protein kinase
VQCLNDEQIKRVLAGGLDDLTAAEVHAHLGTCGDCRARVDARRAVVGGQATSRAAATAPWSGGATDVATHNAVEAAAGDADSTVYSAAVPAAGQSIGPYKLLQKIGEGGFGVVFMAEQREPVRRKVALKVIKLGMDTRQVIARFEQERQALALMDHPHIAKVFDAGATDSGRPYFVMELVTGDPITEYADREHLSIAERLALFSQVCHAVQHAHQKGIIHRDIKPSNVLVHTQDGRPHAKVIDFGTAKATVARLTEKTLFTEHKQFIGTPHYMSPEQAAGSLDIDTRSDVYSLGVLLYELLAGVPPFDPKSLRSAAFAEMVRIIREVEPPKPSTRLSGSTDTLPSIATNRRIEPKKLNALIRGDLDWIVIKALEKDRARRYATATALADDIAHHLNHEPVDAGPPSAAYRVRKFVRRNRAGVMAATIVVVVLLGGIAGTTWGMLWALSERQRADDEAVAARSAEMAASKLAASESQARAKADANAEEARQLFEGATKLNDLLGSLISQALPSSGSQGDTGIFQRLAAQTAEFLNDKDLPAEVELGMRLTIAKTYLRLRRDDLAYGHEERIRAILDTLGANPRTRLEYETTLAVHASWGTRRAARIGRLRPLVESIATDLPLSDPVRAYAFAVLGWLHTDADAVQWFEEALRATPDALPRQNPWWWVAAEGVVFHRGRTGDPRAAIAELELMYETKLETLGPMHSEIGSILGSLCDLYIDTSDSAGIQRTFERAVDQASRIWGAHGDLTIGAYTYYASAFRAIGDHESADRLNKMALQIVRQRFGDDHPRALEHVRGFALEELRQGRPDAAADLLQHIEGDVRRALELDLLRTSRVINTYVDACRGAGRLERIGPWLDSLVPLLEQRDYRDEADAASELAFAMIHAQRPATAERIASGALKSLDNGGATTTPAHVQLWRARGWASMDQGDVDEGMRCYTEAMKLVRAEPNWLLDYEWVFQPYAWDLSNHRGDHEAALKLFQQVAAAQREAGNIEPARIAWNALHQANMLRRLNRFEDSLEAADRGVQLAAGNPEMLGKIEQARGATRQQMGDFDAAISAYEDAVERFRSLASIESRRLLSESLNRLAWLLEKQGRYEAAAMRYREQRDVLLDRNAPPIELAECSLALGRALLNAGQWAEAETELVAADEALRDGDPAHLHRRGESLYFLVVLFERRDDMEPADREAARATWRQRSLQFQESQAQRE